MKPVRLFFIILVLASAFVLTDIAGFKILYYGAILAFLAVKAGNSMVRRGYRVKRILETSRVFAGVGEMNRLLVENQGRVPIAAFLVQDYTDLNISTEQNHPFLLNLPPRGSTVTEYLLYGRKRGKYKIGPTIIRYEDIMGLESHQFQLDTVQEVVVFPNILRIAGMPYKSMQPFGGIKNPYPIFEDPSMITGLKEYQSGDEIKRINWKVSARQGRFFVNNYQPSITSSSWIILNAIAADYPFKNSEFHIERAIETAASLVQELFIKRQELGFVCACRMDGTDTVFRTAIGKGEAHFTTILTALSVMTPARDGRITQALSTSAEWSLSWGTSLYVVTPHLDDESLEKLIRIRESGHSITVINVGPEIRSDLSLWNIGFQSYYAEFAGNLITLMRI